MPTSWDRVLIHVADLYRFKPTLSATLLATGDYPGATPYAPAEPCYVEPSGTLWDHDDQGRLVPTEGYKVFLGRNPGLKSNDTLYWVDAQGTPHVLFLSAPGGSVADHTAGPVVGLLELAAVERART